MNLTSDLTAERTGAIAQPGGWTRLLAWLAGGSRARWLAVGVVLCSVLPAIFSWPEFPVRGAARRNWETYWRDVVQRKINDPWYDYSAGFVHNGNEVKRNFRFTVPLLAHLTHTGLPGVRAIALLLQLALLLCILLAAERACGDRLTALATALAMAATYTGTSVWRDVCLWFDNCAHGFMALALIAGGPWLAAGGVLLAAFTDERTLLAVPVVMLFHVFTGGRRATLVGLAAAVPLYVLLRWILARTHGITTATAGIAELDIFVNNIETAPLGFWFALEGGWLLVALTLPHGLRADWRSAAFWLLPATMLPVGAAAGVGDFTRSAAYGFPATLAALALLGSRTARAPDGSHLRRPALWAAAVSLLVPNLFIMQNIFLETNLPLHLVQLWLRARL